MSGNPTGRMHPNSPWYRGFKGMPDWNSFGGKPANPMRVRNVRSKLTMDEFKDQFYKAAQLRVRKEFPYEIGERIDDYGI